MIFKKTPLKLVEFFLFWERKVIRQSVKCKIENTKCKIESVSRKFCILHFALCILIYLPDKSKFESGVGICGTSWAPSPTEVFWGSGRTECSPTEMRCVGRRVHGVLPYGDEVCWEAGARSAPLRCMMSLSSISTNQILM